MLIRSTEFLAESEPRSWEAALELACHRLAKQQGPETWEIRLIVHRNNVCTDTVCIERDGISDIDAIDLDITEYYARIDAEDFCGMPISVLKLTIEARQIHPVTEILYVDCHKMGNAIEPEESEAC